MKQSIERKIRSVVSGLAIHAPLAYGVVAVLDIGVVDGLLDNGALAATNGFTIMVDRRVAESADPAELAIILVHEALHAIFMHPERLKEFTKSVYERLGIGGDIVPAVFNMVADAKIDWYIRELTGGKVGNDALADLLSRLGLRDAKLVTLDELAKTLSRYIGMDFDEAREMLRKGSVEPIAEEILKKVKTDILKALANGVHRDVDRAYGGSIVIVWRGLVSRDEKLRERLERMIREGRVDEAAAELARAARSLANEARAASGNTRKTVGASEGGIERAIDELAAGRLDLRRLLADAIIAAIAGPRVKRSWSRLNKKLGDVRPGRVRRGTVDEVIAAYDVSGSISDEELSDIGSAIYSAVRYLKPRRVTLVAWDWGVRTVTRVSGSVYSVAKALKSPVKGGGGTSIAGALDYANERAKRGTVVMIASDWFVYDSVESVAEKLDEIRRRGAKIVLIATPEHNTRVFERLANHADVAIIAKHSDPFRRAGV